MVLNVVGSNPTGHPKRLQMKSLFLCTVVHEPTGFVNDEVAADIMIYTHVKIPSFKEIAVLCNDGIQSGDFEVDFGTIVQ